jgi:hypothetical protein
MIGSFASILIRLGLIFLKRHVFVGLQALAPLPAAKYVKQDGTEGEEENQQRQRFGVLKPGKPH